MLKEMLEGLKNNDGLTLKKGNAITYKTGYQVADYGTECKTIAETMEAVKDMHGDCGIWYAEGIYYVDHSMHVMTRKEALAIGREHKQISILRWKDMSLIYC